MKTSCPFIVRHPWIFVFAAFMLLLGAWTALILVASKFEPQSVEIRR